MFSLPMFLFLGGLASAYTCGTKVVGRVGSLLELVLVAVDTGAILSNPKRRIIGPFTLSGHTLSFISCFARNGSGAVDVKMFKIIATEELVTVFIRRNVSKVVCSIIYITIFVARFYGIYRFAVYVMYKLDPDLRVSG